MPYRVPIVVTPGRLSRSLGYWRATRPAAAHTAAVIDNMAAWTSMASTSYAPRLNPTTSDDHLDTMRQDVVRLDVRRDGRSATMLRQVFVQTGMVALAAGSAYIEMENTKVMAAV